MTNLNDHIGGRTKITQDSRTEKFYFPVINFRSKHTLITKN